LAIRVTAETTDPVIQVIDSDRQHIGAFSRRRSPGQQHSAQNEQKNSPGGFRGYLHMKFAAAEVCP